MVVPRRIGMRWVVGMRIHTMGGVCVVALMVDRILWKGALRCGVPVWVSAAGIGERRSGRGIVRRDWQAMGLGASRKWVADAMGGS
jgi:hypothetical protein